MSVVSILRIRRIRMLPMLRPIYSHSFWLEFHYWSMGFLVFFQYKQLIAEWLINKWYDQLKPTWLNRTWRFVKLWINNAARMAGKWLIPGQFWSNFQSNFQSISKAWKTAEKKKKKVNLAANGMDEWCWSERGWRRLVDDIDGRLEDWKKRDKGDKREHKTSIGNIKEEQQHLEQSEEGHLQTAATNHMLQSCPKFLFSPRKTFNNKTNSNKRSQAK